MFIQIICHIFISVKFKDEQQNIKQIRAGSTVIPHRCADTMKKHSLSIYWTLVILLLMPLNYWYCFITQACKLLLKSFFLLDLNLCVDSVTRPEAVLKLSWSCPEAVPVFGPSSLNQSSLLSPGLLQESVCIWLKSVLPLIWCLSAAVHLPADAAIMLPDRGCIKCMMGKAWFLSDRAVLCACGGKFYFI